MNASALAPLSNIVWHSLDGSQSHLSAGSGRIRRFAPGFLFLAAPLLNC